MKYLFSVILFFGILVKSQVINKQRDSTKTGVADTLVLDSGKKDSMQIFRPTILDYTFKTQFGEKKIFDTVFSIQKSYEFTQYNNQDNFGRIQFANIGSGFQDLVYTPNPDQNLSVLPSNKSYFIINQNKIKYYDVKTPTTSFLYHTGMRNGAELQTTYTQNVGKNFNFSIEYMGLRSQGFYQNSLAADNNTIFTGHFLSKNKRYEFYAHFIQQNINNQENGGLANLSLFTGNDNRFKNRVNLPVNLNYSNSRLYYRRYYFSQDFTLSSKPKSTFKLRNTIFHQGNKYFFNSSAAESYYNNITPLNPNKNLFTKKYSDNLSNSIGLVLNMKNLELDAAVKYQYLTLGADNLVLDVNNIYQPLIYKENRFGVEGNLFFKLKDKFFVDFNLEFSKGNQFGNFFVFKKDLKFKFKNNYDIDFRINYQNGAPSFNALLNSSPYSGFNYVYNNFKPQGIFQIGGSLGLKWFQTKLNADFYNLSKFVYFDATGKPNQSTKAVDIAQISGESTFGINHFYLNTKLMLQNELNNQSLYPTPKFIGRFNLYYQSKAFKKAAEIQTGIKAYYFTKFASRSYFPVLNEFTLPTSNAYRIGGEPILDAYFNIKVKTMLIYLETQNFTTLFMNNKSYTAPFYPIYDFRLNIGLVWYLFN